VRSVIPSPLLRTALVADAVVSGGVAVLQLTAASWLSDLLSLPRTLLVESGAFLVAYTVLLVVLARSPRVPSAVVGIIVLGNIGWAVGCFALLAMGAPAPSRFGVAFVLVQAAAVLLFAALEYVGLSASERTAGRRAAFTQ
jgi:hypothetical protein